MPNDRQQRAAQIVTEAFGRPTVTRGDFIADACGDDNELHAEVEALLAADVQAGSFLDKPIVRASEAPVVEDPLEGCAVDGFRIVRRIAVGGMGVVYEAEQQNPHRRVALKVIRAGAASAGTLRRFEHEAHVLALLQHPGIAQVHEAGTFDTGHGRQPFFAMELIDGRPLNDYAESANLDTRRRLDLFANICDAVHYAHQRGVIHRDLKPGNVLVDDAGQAKVLDFGVARVTDSDLQTTTLHTAVGELIGTVPYMSPEQVLGDADSIDIRSDVYALGVMLYELLSGKLPHDLRDKPIPEAARIIREDEITPLSSVNRIFRGDLETIVSKALDKDKDRRYASAAGLAADVRRYLNDEPITARPASAMYQFRKFTRRNKSVVAAAAVVLVAILGGALVSSVLAVKESRARRVAEEQRTLAKEAEGRALREAEAAAQIATFLDEMLAGLDPAVAKGADTELLRLILDATSERVEAELRGQPEVGASIRTTVGNTYLRIGEYEAAERPLAAALQLRRAEFGDEHKDTLASVYNLASAYFHLGRYEDAEPLAIRALEGRRKVLGADDPATLDSVGLLGMVYRQQGRLDRAEPLYLQTLEGRRRVLGEQHEDTLAAMNNVAALYFSRRQYEEAREMFSDLLKVTRRVHGQENSLTVMIMFNLAAQCIELGQYDQAEPLYAQVLEIRRRVLGEHHPDTLVAMNSLGRLYIEMERYDEAESLLEVVVEGARQSMPEGHWYRGYFLAAYAACLKRMERFDEAEAAYLESHNIHVNALGAEHERTIKVITNLAGLYDDWGKPAKATEYRMLLPTVKEATSVDVAASD